MLFAYGNIIKTIGESVEGNDNYIVIFYLCVSFYHQKFVLEVVLFCKILILYAVDRLSCSEFKH